MAHGGARDNAGRKPGALNKATQAAREKAEAEGILPLDYMLSIMRDEDATKAERMDMAKSAAPYIHARLSSIEAKVDADVNATIGGVDWQVVDPQTPGS
jgi:hypothetical protein